MENKVQYKWNKLVQITVEWKDNIKEQRRGMTIGNRRVGRRIWKNASRECICILQRNVENYRIEENRKRKNRPEKTKRKGLIPEVHN
jgi:hypothetical protein